LNDSAHFDETRLPSAASSRTPGHIPLPNSNIRCLQKVCDVYDIFDPAVDFIIRRKLRVVPIAGRRTWELAMIFLALHQAGKLNPSARGLAMGAGKERLIFSVAEHVRETVVTDLYGPDAGWRGVRTTDPQQFVMDAAPWSIPEGRIRVMPMDMRELKIPDSSFDFAWSTGAIEHIGGDEDFLKHFAEVHRTLKPGGVYAFTTVVTYGRESERIPHNHFFHPTHLIDLLHASPLQADPEFDCTVVEHHFNRPLTERPHDFGFRAARSIIHPFVSFRRGIITAANLVIARKPDIAKSRPFVTGFDETAARLRKEADAFTRLLWQSPQILTIEALGQRQGAATQWQYFGKGSFRFSVGFIEPPQERPKVHLFSRTSSYPTSQRLEFTATVQPDCTLHVPFESDPQRLYRIVMRDALDPTQVVVRAHAIGE
jgi:SAM-dependent methyltransferase